MGRLQLLGDTSRLRMVLARPGEATRVPDVAAWKGFLRARRIGREVAHATASGSVPPDRWPSGVGSMGR